MRKMVEQMINSSKIHELIKQHFDACKSKTGVLDKPEKSRNMIAAPKGYDSKGKCCHAIYTQFEMKTINALIV